MHKNSDIVISIQIAGLQGLYWMIFCPLMGFASVYLLSKDFSNQSIGWILAIGSVGAILLQPTLGALADKVKRATLKLILTLMNLVCMSMLTALIFLPLNQTWVAVLYTGIIALLITQPPLVNALTFEYINAGRKINYGLTRSAGSLFFAIVSLLLGGWVERFTTVVLPIVALALFVFFTLLMLSMPRTRLVIQTTPDQSSSPQSTVAKDQPGFLRRYERFIPFLLGVTGLFLFHTIVNNFMPQILIGTQIPISNLGIALTIAAVLEIPFFIGFDRLAAKINIPLLLKLSGIFYLVRSIVFLLASSVWMIYLGQALQALTFAIFLPASVFYINSLMHENDKVKGQTFANGATTLGSVLGSVIGGRLLDASGVPALLWFALGGALVGCLFMLYGVRRHKSGSLSQTPA